MKNIKTKKEMAKELISEHGSNEGLSIAKRALIDCPGTDKNYWQKVVDLINQSNK